MGGGMVYGEPSNYGFLQYPYGGNRTPGHNSSFAPRRQSKPWGDEVGNMARKRKLDGVKGEPLGASKGKNVREIFVENPSLNRSGRRDVQTAKSSSGSSSAPASPSSARPTERNTVTIPVVFTNEASREQPVKIVPPEGTKKPKRAFSEEDAALLIQSVFRGYSVRRTQPLQHMRKITSIRSKLREIEHQLSDSGLVEKMRTDLTAKLQITEGLMALLLQLDSIQGVHADVRVWRKAATKEVVMLQERVDALLKGGQALETKPIEVELSGQGDEEDTAMAADEENVAVEDGGLCHQNDEVVEKDVCVNAEEHSVEGRIDSGGPSDGQRDNLPEPIADEELREEAEQEVGNSVEGMDRRREQVSSASHGVDNNDVSGCETVISTRQPTSDDIRVFTEGVEGRDDESRRESFESSFLDVTRDASDGWTDAADHTTSLEARDNEEASTVVEDELVMEVERDEAYQQICNTECVGSPSEEHDYSFKSCPTAQEKMKDFLKEISSPPGQRASSRISQATRLNVAEEMDCHGAPGTCSDIEESDGAVNRSSPSTRQGNNASDDGAETSGLLERVERDPLLVKLNEENKMLKSLLLDVMKWNQLQANSMKNVMERLGKLEDVLAAKQKKSTSKPKAHRCTRSRLERRLRR